MNTCKSIAIKMLCLTKTDQAVVFATLTSVAALILGPLTILLIVRYFSPELQGYYYTFGSLIALQFILELGMGQAIIQFVSHEWAGLSFNHTGRIVGDFQAYLRLVSLGHLTIKWYVTVAASIVFVLAPVGYVFFVTSPGSASVSWVWPWITVCILLGLNLIITPFFVLLQGCHEVGSYWFYRFIQQTIDGIATVVAILLGFGLWALPIAVACRLIWSIGFLLVRYRGFVASFAIRIREKSTSWHKEVWPIQWRIAIAWFSAYFTTQLFAPVLFRYSGPVAAGQMGMMITLNNVIIAIATNWVVTKAPRFGSLIALRQYVELDALFKRSFSTSVGVAALGAVMGWLGIVILGVFDLPLATRVLLPIPAGLILLSGLFTTIITGLSVYLRAHKREPLVWIYLTSSLIISALTMMLGRQWGATAIALGYCLVLAIFQLPVSLIIFRRSRGTWHRLGAEDSAAILDAVIV
jgi:hypothetical protein